MSQLYTRILLWHKLTAQVTGGLALCSSKRMLNRAEAEDWAARLENVAADVRQFLHDATFVLDAKGQPVVQSGVKAESPTPRFFTKEGTDVAPRNTNPSENSSNATSPHKTGGVRVATRKQK